MMCHKICPISICIYYLQIIGIYLNTFEKIELSIGICICKIFKVLASI